LKENLEIGKGKGEIRVRMNAVTGTVCGFDKADIS
jgi:hypothetical protein